MLNLKNYYTDINKNFSCIGLDKEVKNRIPNMQISDNIIRISFDYGFEILIMKDHNFEADLDVTKLSLDNVIEINYCLSGEVHITFKQTQEKLYMRSGQLCFNSLNSAVCDIIKKPIHYTGISLFIHKDVMEHFLITPYDAQVYQEFLQLLQNTFYENTFTLTAGNVIIKTLSEKLLNLKYPNNTPMMELMFRKTIVSLLYETAEYIFDMATNSYNAPQIEIAKAILFDNLTDPPSVERLAKLCNISISTLKAGFKVHYNDTVYGVLRKERLHKAHQLLIEGSSVADAAVAVGYANPSQFAKAFKIHYGCTPKALKSKI